MAKKKNRRKRTDLTQKKSYLNDITKKAGVKKFLKNSEEIKIKNQNILVVDFLFRYLCSQDEKFDSAEIEGFGESTFLRLNFLLSIIYPKMIEKLSENIKILRVSSRDVLIVQKEIKKNSKFLIENITYKVFEENKSKVSATYRSIALIHNQTLYRVLANSNILNDIMYSSELLKEYESDFLPYILSTNSIKPLPYFQARDEIKRLEQQPATKVCGKYTASPFFKGYF